MISQLTAYITLVATSGVLNLYLCAYVFLRRRDFSNSAPYFILYSAAIVIYCFSYAIGLTSDTIEQLLFWTVMQYIGMPFAPPFGLLFIMKYLGMNVTKGRIAALMIIPLISLIMVATNDLHGLHYQVFEIPDGMSAPYVHLEVGPWYVVHGIFTFGCMFAGLLLLLFRWRESAKPYRFQMFTLIIGQLIPILTAFLYLIGAGPPGIDPVPMVVWVTSGLYLIAIISSRMLKIIPIAKDTIFNSMSDGVFVLDASRRLVEYNQVCKDMFPKLDRSMFGQHLDQVWNAVAGQSFPFRSHSPMNLQELKLADRIYEVRFSQLQHQAGSLIIFIDITELKHLQHQLEHLAYYDELTQIYNRRAFFGRCEAMFAELKLQQKPLTVILFDIDFFKRVNDNYGHNVGDQLLVHVVHICGTLLTDEMLFARYGGEEFVIALPGRTKAEGRDIAEHIRNKLEALPLQHAEASIPVTSSFGVAEGTGVEEETFHLLLHKADEALYQAKRSGRNQVRVYA